jgi:transcriptional regulator with XRE-family HTH domain
MNKMQDSIPELIKETRTAIKATQAELGALLEVSPNTIARWERGEVTPDSPRILRLALRQLQMEYGLPDLDPVMGKRLRQSIKELKRTKRELTEMIKSTTRTN